MKRLLVFGAGDHAKVVIDAVEAAGEYAVAALIEKSPCASSAGPYPLVAEREAGRLLAEVDAGVVGIGDNWTRAAVVARIRSAKPDFRFAVVRHPSAVVAAGVSVGEGTVIMAGAVINRGTAVGAHCIINTGACVDHDNLIRDFASIAPRAVTGGRVRVGRYSAVGLGAAVREGVAIGEHTVVGAGALVLKDVPDGVVAYGVPARVIRLRQPGEPYLNVGGGGAV